MKLVEQHYPAPEKLLHHRHPFLLLGKVNAITEDTLIASKLLEASEPFFQGHFPGLPVLPGALMLEMLIEAGGYFMSYNDPRPTMAQGVLVRAQHLKFKGFARPGDLIQLQVTLQQQWDELAVFKGFLKVEERKIMEGTITLGNLPLDTLRGEHA